ncbi:MAG: cell division inhibitor SidA [Proteobacteria bacterium]|nr:cell division inhibitor SidA [Pseudomonadota bacterium]
MFAMVRLARESLAFVSVASFCWMVCAMAAHMG